MTRPGIQFRLSPVQLLFSHRIWMAGMQESVPNPPASDPSSFDWYFRWVQKSVNFIVQLIWPICDSISIRVSAIRCQSDPLWVSLYAAIWVQQYVDCGRVFASGDRLAKQIIYLYPRQVFEFLLRGLHSPPRSQASLFWWVLNESSSGSRGSRLAAVGSRSGCIPLIRPFIWILLVECSPSSLRIIKVWLRFNSSPNCFVAYLFVEMENLCKLPKTRTPPRGISQIMIITNCGRYLYNIPFMMELFISDGRETTI